MLYTTYIILIYMYVFPDVDECGRNIHACLQICLNTVGTYHCACFDGFTLNNDSRFCDGNYGVMSQYYVIIDLWIIINYILLTKRLHDDYLYCGSCL